MEEEETGKIEVLHSAIVAPGWAAKHCLECSAGTRGLRQAMESVVVVHTMLTGAGLLCSSSVAGTALHSALEFVPLTTALTPSAALGPGRPLFCPSLLSQLRWALALPPVLLPTRPEEGETGEWDKARVIFQCFI